MKKSMVLSMLLVFLIYSGIFAQGRGDIAWEMAVLKWTGSNFESFSPQRPITMQTGDAYQIYIKFDSPGYCYIVQENSDRTSSIIFNGPLTAGQTMFFPGEDEEYIASADTGTIRFHVVVSSSQRTNLERYMSQGTGARLAGAQHTALVDEIRAINRSIATVAEAPERPVVMGGAVRGTSYVAYRYEGQGTYVKTITIRF